MALYRAVPLKRSQLFHKHSQNTSHSSPVRTSYGVSDFDLASCWYSASVLEVIYVISYNIGPRYNGTRLYSVNYAYQKYILTSACAWYLLRRKELMISITDSAEVICRQLSNQFTTRLIFVPIIRKACRNDEVVKHDQSSVWFKIWRWSMIHPYTLVMALEWHFSGSSSTVEWWINS